MGLKKQEHKVWVEAKDQNVILVDGKRYRMAEVTFLKKNGIEHMNKFIYKQVVDDTERKEKLKEIIKSLSKKVNVSDFFLDYLQDIPDKEVEKIFNLIKSKKPIRKHVGCLGVQIGKNCYLELRQ